MKPKRLSTLLISLLAAMSLLLTACPAPGDGTVDEGAATEPAIEGSELETEAEDAIEDTGDAVEDATDAE